MLRYFAFCLLALVAFSVTAELKHEQVLPIGGGSTVGGGHHQPSLPTPGDPRGRHKDTKATCFNAPCF